CKDCSGLHNFEIGSCNLLQQIQIGVVPAMIRCAADEDCAAIVGQNQSVFLQGSQNHLVIRWVTGNIDGGFEAKPKTHGRSIRIGRGGGPVSGGKNERLLRGGYGESKGVVDGACGNFVIPCKPDKDRQSRRVSRSPGIGPLLVDGHIPNGGRVGAPIPVFQPGFIKFISQQPCFSSTST